MNEAILRAIDMLQDYKGVLAAQTFADNDEGDHWQRINENKRTSVHAAIVGLRAILAAPSPVLADVPTLDPACCGDANDCPIDYSDCPHKGMPPAPKCNVCGVKVLECDKNGCCGMPTCLDELERLNNKL
jgi:hypothetical protein